MSTDADEPATTASSSIFADHIRYVLDREYERAARSVGRAETIFKSQVAILTVVLAVATFLYKDGRGPALAVRTRWDFVIAVAAAVFSLVTATFAQSGATKTSGTTLQTIEDMLSAERWHDSADALYVTACRDRDSIRNLRKSNHNRARLADTALYFQVGSIVLAVVGVGYELAVRVDWL